MGSFMPDNASSAADRERVVRTLQHVERKLRTDRLTRELLAGFTVSLSVPLGLTVWYRFSPLTSAAVLAVVGGWLVALAAYAGWKLAQRGTLSAAAAAVDRKADLYDELTTAYWFHRQSETSGWIELQSQRAARTADGLSVDRLYPWMLPHTSRVTVALVALVFVLNLIPLSWTRGWLQAQPPVVAELTDEQRRLLDQMQRMLDEATLLDGTELARSPEELMAELRRGQLSPEDTVELRSLLENIDLELIDELTRQDLEHVLIDPIDLDAAELEALEASLEELSEEARQALEDLSNSAESLQESELSQQALEDLANELQQLGEEQRSTELSEADAEDLDQLEQALRERSEGEGQQRMTQTDQAPGADQTAAAAEDGAMPDGEVGLATEASDTGTPTMEQGRGDLSAPPGAGDIIEYGEPTRLEVELYPEILELTPGPDDEPEDMLIDQPSEAARSKLQYEQVETTLPYAEPDLLDADRIPWPYRDLVKLYFQAVGPRGKHDH